MIWRLRNSESEKELAKLREVLRATVKGLLDNPSVTASTIVAYCMSLFEDAEKVASATQSSSTKLASTTDVWTTSSLGRRGTSDGRSALLVEKESRLTGDNRHASLRAKVNRTSEEELVDYAFLLLNGALEKKLLVPTNDSHRQLTGSLAGNLLFALRSYRRSEVVKNCLRFIDGLLPWKLESLERQVDSLRRMIGCLSY